MRKEDYSLVVRGKFEIPTKFLKMSQRTPKAALPPTRSLKSPRSSGRTPKSARKSPSTPESGRAKKAFGTIRKKIRTPGSSGKRKSVNVTPQQQQEKSVTVCKQDLKRDKVINEIVDSEKKYLQQLCTVIQCFYNPIRKTGLLPDDISSTIFSNIITIRAVNQELLLHLETFNVGKAFLLVAPFLRHYSTYANSFVKASSMLEEWSMKNSDFAEFKCLQESKPACCSLKLHALLITPVQRIPRYKLLLEELLENTSPEHDDYDHLKEASKQVGDVAYSINENLKEHDNFQKMLDIQNCMVGEGAPRILSPGRRFVKEGALKKVSKNGAKYHDRMFFLFSDILLYAKPTFLENTDSASTFTCRCIITLLECSVECVLGDNRVPGAGALFKISFGDDSLLLFHEDQNIALSWVETLRSAIFTIKRNMASLRKTRNTVDASPLVRRSRVRTSLRFQVKRKRSDTESDPSTKIDSLYPMRKYMESLKQTTKETPSKRRRLAKNEQIQKEQKMNESKFTEADTVYKTPKQTSQESTFHTPATSMARRMRRHFDTPGNHVRHGNHLSDRLSNVKRKDTADSQHHVTNDGYCTIL